MIVPGETEAGTAGRNHTEGKPVGLIETMNGARRPRFRALQETNIGSVDTDALKIPTRRAEY
jgi:hypothetical protein